MEEIINVVFLLSIVFLHECNSSGIPLNKFEVQEFPVNQTNIIPSYPNQQSWLTKKFGRKKTDQTSLPKIMMGNLDENKLALKLDRDYTPLEIAEYIYATGDEKGISQGVLEMVQDGKIMLSYDDIIQFLEVVQRYLDRMRKNKQSDSVNVDVNA